MRNIFSLLMVCILALTLSACLDKKEEVRENTKDNSSEETSEGTNEEGESSGEESQSGVTDGIGDPQYGVDVIPTGFKGYKGKPVEAASWTDSNGDNLVIITESGSSDRQLYGYHFIMDGNDGEELWMIQDYIKDCEFDIRLDYVPESLSITDLDADGIGESTFLYNMSCKSDVSPDDLKLMMHENDNKYALRGYTYIANVDAGGDYKVDAAFNNAPASFLEYAKEQWNRHKNFDY